MCWTPWICLSPVHLHASTVLPSDLALAAHGKKTDTKYLSLSTNKISDKIDPLNNPIAKEYTKKGNSALTDDATI
jgi:hypothetical protein